jgi:hypothetical protein
MIDPFTQQINKKNIPGKELRSCPVKKGMHILLGLLMILVPRSIRSCWLLYLKILSSLQRGPNSLLKL